MSSYSELELKVLRWSEDRRIVPNSTALAQSIKGLEEINELIKALEDDDMAEAIDAVGDTVVCLINVCALMDVNLVDCLESAYEEIKDRKGSMNEQGIFVKEDLQAEEEEFKRIELEAAFRQIRKLEIVLTELN